MKRNKPIVRQRKAGTQHRRRWSYNWDERRAGGWLLLVPEAMRVSRHRLAEVMATAVPAGLAGTPMWTTSLARWRVDVDGATWTVWTIEGEPSTDGRLPWGLSGKSLGDAACIVYSAERKCGRGPDCPQARRFLADDCVSEVTRHVVGRCPMAVLEPGVWKFHGTAHRVGMDWYV